MFSSISGQNLGNANFILQICSKPFGEHHKGMRVCCIYQSHGNWITDKPEQPRKHITLSMNSQLGCLEFAVSDQTAYLKCNDLPIYLMSELMLALVRTF